VEAFVEECATSSNGKHVAHVNQMSQALNRLRTMVSVVKDSQPNVVPPTGDCAGWMR
jgi:hypothetical protein